MVLGVYCPLYMYLLRNLTWVVHDFSVIDCRFEQATPLIGHRRAITEKLQRHQIAGFSRLSGLKGESGIYWNCGAQDTSHPSGHPLS